MADMRLAGNRYKVPASDQEMDRRLHAVQAAMKKLDLDGCVFYTTSVFFDAVIRYLVDRPTHNYGNTLIIPPEGLMTLINHGGDNDNAALAPNMRNVEKHITKAFCLSFNCTDNVHGEAVVKELKRRGWKRIGMPYMQLVTANLIDYIRAEIPGIEIVDFSKEFSRIKAKKSPEEWELIKTSIDTHEKIMEMVPSLIKPGRKEFEILTDIEHEAILSGADYIGNVSVGAAVPGQNAVFCRNYYANRTIERGDIVTVLVEVAAPGGLYGELARIFALGEPNESLVDLYNIAVGCQDALAAAAKPGMTGKDLNDVFNNYVRPYGLPDNSRFGGHSQGYDMMEPPTICALEDLELEEDMYFAIHPELTRNGEFAIACDNYRIGKDGATRLNRCERKIFRLDY